MDYAQTLANLILDQQLIAKADVDMQGLAESQSSRAKYDYLQSRPDAPEDMQQIVAENNGGRRRGAPGYQPQITTLPEGTSMNARAATADRLHVIVSPAPSFSAITDVDTFTFAGASAGGIGGTGGGLGGGIGGGAAGGGGIGGGGAGGGGLGGGLF